MHEACNVSRSMRHNRPLVSQIQMQLASDFNGGIIWAMFQDLYTLKNVNSSWCTKQILYNEMNSILHLFKNHEKNVPVMDVCN